jgi:hypothetical protein
VHPIDPRNAAKGPQVSESKQLRRIRLDAEWDMFKRRHGVTSFTDDRGAPIDEASLSDDDKREILARYNGRPSVMLIDLTPERKADTPKGSRFRRIVRRILPRWLNLYWISTNA